MAYTLSQPVMFHHCDPAGIVFYPRYFEMANIAVESWFRDRLDLPFEVLHATLGLAVPTARIEITFNAPSRHGDRLDFTLAPHRIGRASLDLSILATCADERRFTMASTLVLAHIAGGRSHPWPDDLRAALSTEIEPLEAP